MMGIVQHRRLLVVLFSMAALWVASGGMRAHAEDITIGTGGLTGVYYPAGQAICAAVNKRADKFGIRCTAVATKGSVENVEGVRAGTFDFGIVQSDVQYFAVNGFGPFKAAGPDGTLRSVLSLHSEGFTVVARADAGIHTLDDLKGKRVNIGNVGSGQRTSMELLMNLKRWSAADFKQLTELSSDQQGQALCDGAIDAFVFTAGHPNDSIKKTAQQCDVVLVQSYDDTVKKLIEKFPYFGPVRVPGNTYKGSGSSAATFGVSATLVASANTSKAAVEAVIKSIFEDYIDFRFSHPALSGLNPVEMVKTKTFAPLHPAAAAYYDRLGYMPLVDHVQPPR